MRRCTRRRLYRCLFGSDSEQRHPSADLASIQWHRSARIGQRRLFCLGLARVLGKHGEEILALHAFRASRFRALHDAAVAGHHRHASWRAVAGKKLDNVVVGAAPGSSALDHDAPDPRSPARHAVAHQPHRIASESASRNQFRQRLRLAHGQLAGKDAGDMKYVVSVDNERQGWAG